MLCLLTQVRNASEIDDTDVIPGHIWSMTMMTMCTEMAMNSSLLSGCDRVLSVFSLHACAHTCVFVCVLACFTCVHAPRGETGCVGCYLLLQRVTANHQPWQTLGEKQEREEMASGERIGIWIPLSNWVFRFCHHNLCMGLGLSWTTMLPPIWPIDN